MKRALPIALLAAWLLCAPGCSTIVQAMKGGTGISVDGPAIYGGTRAIAGTWYDVFHGIRVQEPTLVIVSLDWITSLVADTLILPWAIVNEVFFEDFPMNVQAFHEMWE